MSAILCESSAAELPPLPHLKHPLSMLWVHSYGNALSSAVSSRALLVFPNNAEKRGDIILAADGMKQIKVDHAYKLLQALDGIRSPEGSDSFDLFRLRRGTIRCDLMTKEINGRPANLTLGNNNDQLVVLKMRKQWTTLV